MKRGDRVRVCGFLDAVYDDCEGFVEVRVLHPPEQAFFVVGDSAGLTAFVKPRRSRNCYVGVAVRASDADGTLANCSLLPALFADVDFKDFPSEADARQRVKRSPLSPSIVVFSGGGLQLWWLLKEPIDLRTDAAEAKSTLRRLAISLGADLAAAEPAHSSPPPNTRNFKYKPPRPSSSRSVRASASIRRERIRSLAAGRAARGARCLATTIIRRHPCRAAQCSFNKFGWHHASRWNGGSRHCRRVARRE